MEIARRLPRPGRDGLLPIVAGVLVFVLAALLFSRYGIGGSLFRDEAIYVYGGQQMTHGIPPYASIFDVKAPLATMLCGLGAAVAHRLGRNDLSVIRVGYYLSACLAAVATYLLGARVWRSSLAGFAGAAVFTCFTGFAQDALAGPDAKTPGVLFAVVSMWFMARRQWFWGAFVGALAFLVWQPLGVYWILAIALAAFDKERGRLRSVGHALAGALIPFAAVTIYLATAGALGKFWTAAFVFALTGTSHGHETVAHRVHHIFDVIRQFYGVSGALLLIGMAALVVLALGRLVLRRREWGLAWRHPLICVVGVSFVVEAGYACWDFQGYPDVYPLLPYGALGLGGLVAAVATVLRRPALRGVLTAGTLVALLVLAGFSWTWFSGASGDHRLRAQRADACAIERTVTPRAGLYSLGDPGPLVLTHRRNPSRFIYLASGVDRWKIAHTPGGFAGWTAQIHRAHPGVVVIHSWPRRTARRMRVWLRGSGYRGRYFGAWHVFLTPAAMARAQQQDVRLATRPTHVARDRSGHRLPAAPCATLTDRSSVRSDGDTVGLPQ